jgi:hypothetical protein
VRPELEYYFGKELVAELDRIARDIVPTAEAKGKNSLQFN